MARKGEIKVYLPQKLIGELEGRRRAGTRSKFIQHAIEKYLRQRQEISPFDFTTVHLLCTVRDKLRADGLTTFANIIQAIIEDVNS